MELSTFEIDRIIKTPMNFVVGKERSGTTLLQVMLNSHPNIVAPPESRFIILLHPRYGSIKHWTDTHITAFCNDLFKEALFRNFWNIKKEDLIAWLSPIKEKLNYPLLCKLVFYYGAPLGKDIKVFFDKNPVYYYFLPILEKLFPEAKFIHLVRDYRANIASHRRVFKIKKAADLAYRWVKINELAEGRKRHGVPYFTLKYEDMVISPEESLRSVCKFLDLPYNDDMGKNHIASIYDSFKKNDKDRFKEMHKNLFEPINPVHVDEWKQNLSQGAISEAESVAGEYGMKLYGYGMIASHKSPISLSSLLLMKLKYQLIKRVYKVVFSNLSLYYYVRQNIWRDF